MKLSAVLLAGSLAANVLLLGVCAFRWAAPASNVPGSFRAATDKLSSVGSGASSTLREPANVNQTPKMPAPAAAKAGLWAELKTDDLSELLARLRAAGFPAWAIRSVIGSEITDRYSGRLAALLRPPPTDFWRQPKLLSQDPQRLAAYLQLSTERIRVLNGLLGAEADPDDPQATAAMRRQYGDLSGAKLASVELVTRDYDELTRMLRSSMNGILLPQDRERLDLLEREKQADLAAILTPQELEDYEMRSSPLTYQLRPALGLFHATEAEFRAIFRIEQPLTDNLYGTYQVSTLLAEQEKIGEPLKAALGEQRYAEFVRSNDSDYQTLVQLAATSHLPDEAVTQAFALRDTLARESNRIYDDPGLTTEQKRAALQSLGQDTRAQLLAKLGPTAGGVFLQKADFWLTGVERGGAVSFPVSSTRLRQLAQPAATAK